MYAIIDIEATGGNAQIGKVTEIAIFRHDGNQVVDQFSSLVNPEMNIPPYVQRLTGINNKMARQAPTFKEIIKPISAITKDAILVAHNAKADYSFVKAEFDFAGEEFKRQRLCTLQLSRELIPGMDSYNLKKLCQSLEIPISGHHRATNDAQATVFLFQKLLKLDPEKVIKSIRKL